MSPSADGTILPSCRPPPQPSPQGGGCPVGGRWTISDRAAIRGTAYVAHPPPSLPHNGGGAVWRWWHHLAGPTGPHPPPCGEGWGGGGQHTSTLRRARPPVPWPSRQHRRQDLEHPLRVVQHVVIGEADDVVAFAPQKRVPPPIAPDRRRRAVGIAVDL